MFNTKFCLIVIFLLILFIIIFQFIIFRNKLIDNFGNNDSSSSGIGINPDGTYCQMNSSSINSNCKSIDLNNIDNEYDHYSLPWEHQAKKLSEKLYTMYISSSK